MTKEMILEQFPAEMRELVQAYAVAPQEPVTRILNSTDTNNLICPQIGSELVEYGAVIFLNNNNNVLYVDHDLFKGGISGTVFDVRVVFKQALLHNATGLILAHNHPSGSTTPSRADKEVTEEFVQAGKILKIRVLDHLIVTASGDYYSFADEGGI